MCLPYCCSVDLVNPGYPNKLVLKLTVSLLLLWLWSLHDHLPVFIWLWLSLSLLLKSLKEHSLQPSTYSRFISGIERRLIYGGCCFFNFSTLFDMKHWFEFKYWLFVHVLVIIKLFHISFIRRSVVVGFLACHVEESAAGMEAEPLLLFSLHHVP